MKKTTKKKNVEMKIESILERNARVESDKAWETSKTRRGLIAIATYAIVSYFLVSIRAPNPFVNALVPTTGYVLSTLSLPFIKTWWNESVYKK